MKISKRKFTIFLVLIYLFYGFSVTVNAQEVSSPSAQASESSKINYELSYPGLLPDHPLYFIKAGRDKIVAFFLSKPLKKAEFEVLLADKRVEASFLLVQKGKKDLAESTFSKADNYFEDAVVKTEDARSQGMNVSEMAKHLDLSNSKHQEVFSQIQETLGKEDKKKWAKEQDRMKSFEKKVKKLLK